MPRRPPEIELAFPISCELFARIETAVRLTGYGAAIDWSEDAQAPRSAAAFASEAIYVICNSGMSNRVAKPIFDRCMAAVRGNESASTVFGHLQKAAAIDEIWRRRLPLFRELRKSDDLIEFCGRLPWVGPVTKYHLAKNLGANVAKPDVHLNRLAEPEGVTAQELCERLAQETGYRIATIDLILWRACADGIIHSKRSAK